MKSFYIVPVLPFAERPQHCSGSLEALPNYIRIEDVIKSVPPPPPLLVGSL